MQEKTSQIPLKFSGPEVEKRSLDVYEAFSQGGFDMNNFTYERLHNNLQYLKLNTIEELLDNYLEIAARDSKTTMEVLDYLFEQERKHREAAAIERRMKSAGFPVKKTLEEFDFEFQSSIDKKVIEDLATLRFIHNAENVVLLGPPGVGKSHLAIALGIEAVKAGFSVYFTNAGNLIERLKTANREGILEKKIRDLMKYKVLIIDEIGYLPFDEEGAHCLISADLQTLRKELNDLYLE